MPAVAENRRMYYENGWLRIFKKMFDSLIGLMFDSSFET